MCRGRPLAGSRSPNVQRAAPHPLPPPAPRGAPGIAGQWGPRGSRLGTVLLKAPRQVPARLQTPFWETDGPGAQSRPFLMRRMRSGGSARCPAPASSREPLPPPAALPGEQSPPTPTPTPHRRPRSVTWTSRPPGGAARARPADRPSEWTGRGGAAGRLGPTKPRAGAARPGPPRPAGEGYETAEGVRGGGSEVTRAGTKCAGRARLGGTAEDPGATRMETAGFVGRWGHRIWM